ncbi:MAG: hypothetical protein NT154_11125 [Verrucomicrobia bacterium]|nr:hypothetical protein [Verrucomicrobiota bacterium]
MKSEKMNRALVRTFLAVAILAGEARAQTQTSAAFQIEGDITRPNDGCNQALVVLCDQTSGEPLGRKTLQPFTLALGTSNDAFAMDWLQAVPDAAGHFQFTNLPAGNYIVVAQAWNSPLPRTNLMDNSREFQIAARDVRAETIHLLGREEVTVPSDRARRLKPTPPGTNSIRFAYQHDGDSLMLGTQPQRGDPVLQWLGWGTNFISHLIGFGGIPRGGGLLVQGLPSEAYASIFSNDNSPGFGSTRLTFGETNAVKIPVVAGWSDGYKIPPTNLVWLVELLQTNKLNIDALLGITSRPPARRNFIERERDKARLILPIWEKEIILPTGQTTRVVDLVTALGYARLNGKYGN